VPFRKVASMVIFLMKKRLRIYPLKDSFKDFFHIPDPDNAGVGTKDKI